MNLPINKIIQGDCLEVLRTLPSESVDVVFTSPPYNKAGHEGFIRKSHPSDAWSKRNIDYDNNAENDFMPESEYEDWQIKVLNELCRVIKKNGSIFYNHKVRVAQHKASHPMEWILKTNCIFRQQIIWDRGSTPTLAPIRFLPTTELIFWLTKDRVQPNFNRQGNITEVLRINPDTNNNHPAPFPEQLVMTILKNCGGDIVLDPFIGSGTTAVVAKKLGRKYIGIELNPDYIKIANDRLAQEVLF